MKLDGARVMITGASRGIGRQMAGDFAAAGARVALVARSADELGKLAADLGGDAYPADLGDPAQVEGLFDRIDDDGPIDVLVNNAGVENAASFRHSDPASIAQLYQINLVAPTELSRQALNRMVPRHRGRIVNVSSLGSVGATPGLVAYCASKAGLSHFTAGLRSELKGTGVGTTLVEVGPVLTGMLDNVHAYGPTARAFRRGARLGLLVDLDPEVVSAAVVAAVRRERRHVRLPRRAAPLMIIGEVPRRFTEFLLVGVDAHRP